MPTAAIPSKQAGFVPGRRRAPRQQGLVPARMRMAALLTVAILGTLPATAAGQPFESFESLRQHYAEQAFHATATYLTENPGAADATEAFRFLFRTALAEDRVAAASPHAQRFLQTAGDASASDKSLARRVAMLALAQDGEADAAIELLGEELAAVRRLDPSSAIDSATALAAAIQRGGRPEAARQVYERLRRAFFLNAGVEAIVENRLARLQLLGEPVPEFGLADLDGNPVPGTIFSERVVLIDFWATNCPPCLEELPQLRRLYADQQKEGFDILAVSLDEDGTPVREFLARSEVAWRVFLSTADDDETRGRFHVETIPANFLVGPDGRIAAVDLHGADLRAEVERLLKEMQERTEPQGVASE